MRFFCIIDDLPEESPRLLKAACDERQIEYVAVDASTFDYDPSQKLLPGDLLFRPAATRAAIHVERFLFADGVATFYADARRVYFDTSAPKLLLQRAGVPLPAALLCATADRAVVDDYVARLGGLPVVVNLGSEGGRGVIMLETWNALYSTLDFCAEHGLVAEMTAFVPESTHWRVVVVDRRAVVAYVNPIRERDFRSSPSGDPADYTQTIEPRLARVAINATEALGLTFGGVDVLRTIDGRHCVLEVNFPCYFPQAQVVGKIDVAGAIVDGLVAIAQRGGTRAPL